MARRTIHADAPSRRLARGLGLLTIALALTTGGAVAASAAPTTTTTSTTSTTAPGSTTTTAPTSTPPTTVAILPPPPPFLPGDDFGRLLLLHRRDAITALAIANTDITSSTRLVALTSEHVKVAHDAQAQARAYAKAVVLKLVSIHEQIKELAVDAYMLGSSPQLSGTLASFSSARDVVDLSRNLTFVHSSNDRLFELVDLEQREQARAAAREHDAATAVTVAVDDLRNATAGLVDARNRRATALADIAQAARDETRLFDDATTSASPIMGPSRLTADDLVAYVASLHLHPHLTVPLRTLAGFYIAEGNAEGIRGDVAFAQSVLETGAFMFPGHGLVLPTDNNFAGIDACDSCKHGDAFDSALIGVRAQMQLLRVYADPSLKKITDFANPVALLHEPRLGSTGFAKTWYSLGGRWATGPNYGFHIYDIYMQMVALAERTRASAPRPSG
jgi:Mannosyl-glycoprotein endo-beta-N-acetylglucosaminidase